MNIVLGILTIFAVWYLLARAFGQKKETQTERPKEKINMRMVGVATKESLDKYYISHRTDRQYVFNIDDRDCMISASIFKAHEIFYFHMEMEDSKILNVIVDTVHREEFRGCTARNLLKIVPPPLHRTRWICAPEGGPIWAEPLPNPLADL